MKIVHASPPLSPQIRWQPEWVRLVLDDGTYLLCEDGRELGPEDPSHDLRCREE